MRGELVPRAITILSRVPEVCHICETKLDDSFNKAQFEVDSYKLYRRDRDKDGGGQLVYIRADMPSRRLDSLESSSLESIVCEVTLDSDKWAFIFIYRPPAINGQAALKDLEGILNKVLMKYKYIFLSGDLNFNLLDKDGLGKPLLDLLNVFGMKNLVKHATCFKSADNPSLLDVLCTNAPNLFFKTKEWDLGISDFHKMVTTVRRCRLPPTRDNYITYRSYKDFDEDKFQRDVSNIPYLNLPILPEDDTNVHYWAYNSLFMDVVDEHLPLKTRKAKRKPCTFMNSKWRKAINKRNMLRNRYFAYRTHANWENYRKQRNFCVSLRRQSVQNYFTERCAGGTKSKDFWPTIKPFLSKNGGSSTGNIFLNEGDELVTKPEEVCNVFNDFYVNVANDIGKDAGNYLHDYSDHPSIMAIKENVNIVNKFNFNPVSEEYILKCITDLNSKKSAGCDGINAKIVKSCSQQIAPHITTLVNHHIANKSFPDSLKMANVTPVYKKKDFLDKANYRPVSILPCISKIFERALSDQLTAYMNDIFSSMLSAYRKKHSCQHVLIDLIEDWKSNLDNKSFVGAVLMDLSKAFDCLPHDLLLAKLKAYGLSDEAAETLGSYLSDRLQRVKLGSVFSVWERIIKGVPQGSILGPLLFNIFINDIFYILKNCNLKNYADDNTLSESDTDLESLKGKLSHSSELAIDWFKTNFMQANPEKFHCIFIGPNRKSIDTELSFNGISITSEPEVELLGITIDDKLNFNTHVSNLVTKAARQLNALKRIGNFLSQSCRLNIFRTFVLSNFNYCPLVWHFCSAQHVERLEKIQKRGLQFVFRDYSSEYETLLEKAGLDTLNLSRLKVLACEVYKVVNNQGPAYLKDVFKLRKTAYELKGEENLSLEVPTIRTETFGRHSLRTLAPQVWNSIPSNTRWAVTLKEFKTLLGTWSGIQCKCKMCKDMN